MINLEIIARWPGKSANDHGVEHPAIYHMLDVAAVAEQLLKGTDLPYARREALTLLAALHDIGKLHPKFTEMLRGGDSYALSHWRLSEVYLEHFEDLLIGALKSETPRRLKPLIYATAGHHGRPSDWSRDDKKRAKKLVPHDVRLTIEAFIRLWPNASLAGLSEVDAQELSWWFSGLVTTADWIGSNTNWFHAQKPKLLLSDYLNEARKNVEFALNEAGLGLVEPTSKSLFNWPKLRPMQSECQSVPLTDGPMLAIIEDETGAGKTEAALMLAQRMLNAGKGQGLFFALPTMATADAMFSRVSRSIGKMFLQKPSVTLAHGRAGLSEEYRDIQAGRPNAPEDVSCTEWLADSRRRALLANVGVGTIDQALLSVLPVKFQALRHYGLSSKILIVDEVHELGEPYIAEVLGAVLKLHRAAGGSAILLTATLPMKLRQRLLATYSGDDALDRAYPALTVARGTQVRDLPQVTGPKGSVKVERLATQAEAVSLIKEKSAAGAACVWIRNSVDDAISAVEALRAGGLDADLLHARYAMGDRKRIERAMRERFGKSGRGREGRILVGTQVLEASLDLDFDLMVSDLAPMAGLVQRVGRLWRHMDIRPADTRPVPAPVLYVLSPDPLLVEHERWLMEVLDHGAYTYSSDIMWRSAYHLFDKGEIVAPSGIRSLIEHAYSDMPESPTVLEKFEIERTGKNVADCALATMNIVDVQAGYRLGGQSHNDRNYPTRLGPEQQILVLAKVKDDVLMPYFDGPDGWAMSEVSCARHRLAKLELPDQQDYKIKEITGAWKDWQRERYVLCPVSDEGDICEGLRYRSEKGLIFQSHLK